MKRYSPVIFIIVFILVDTANACTVHIVGPRRAYRASSRVFIGELVSHPDPSSFELPPILADWKGLGKARFKIERSWKGPKKGETDLYLNPWCNCPTRLLLPKPGEKLLIFADKDGVVDACEMYVIEMKDDRQNDKLKGVMRRLDSFWFRTWANIYPF